VTIDHSPRLGMAWPGLDVVPSGPRAAVSAVVARRLFLGAVSRLPVTVSVAATRPGCSTTVIGQGGPAMTVHRPDEFFARLGRDHLIGFGEAYLTGAWDAEDLGGFLAVLAADLPRLIPPSLQRLRGLVVRRPPLTQRSTQENSRSNIAHHYDLSNELFETFLDETLTYSSPLFDTSIDRSVGPGGTVLHAAAPAPDAPAESLGEAQARKLERLLDRTGVGAGTRVLELGTGWGELAIRAARRGATVRTITLSSEQQALAQERIAAAGFAHRVTVELLDYRAVSTGARSDERYDAVLSVEMIEAVGHDFWTTYFQTIDRVLAPGGRVGIQAITMRHDRMLATRNTHTWINKYIFPGGFLPSTEAIEQITSQRTTLRMVERLTFGSHYAETLRRWDNAFMVAADRIRDLGFDETFQRMWHFYLEYSRGGFASGYIDVQQLVLAREGGAWTS
jgi:cyclopropane-fatty-acyl-phospholipid synthase